MILGSFGLVAWAAIAISITVFRLRSSWGPQLSAEVGWAGATGFVSDFWRKLEKIKWKLNAQNILPILMSQNKMTSDQTVPDN